MPLYDFECAFCEHVDEDVVQNWYDDDILPCSVCGGESFRRPAAPAFHLKGHGWTGKIHHRGLRADWKSSEDTLEEDSNGKLRTKTGAGHDAL